MYGHCVTEPPVHPPGEVEKNHTGFLHSIADSMRETSGIARHDAPKPSVQLPEGEAPEPGTVEKIKASISGVAGASQVLGWGAQGSKGSKKSASAGVEGTVPSAEGLVPSVEAGADLSAPALDASASMPSVEGSVTAPAVEGDLTLPSGSTDVGCERSHLCSRLSFGVAMVVDSNVQCHLCLDMSGRAERMRVSPGWNGGS